jgi:hypothetical protein
MMAKKKKTYPKRIETRVFLESAVFGREFFKSETAFDFAQLQRVMANAVGNTRHDGIARRVGFEVRVLGSEAGE